MKGDKLASFIALYRGDSISAAQLVATTADPNLVRDFAERMLSRSEEQEPDAVLRELALGRRRALRLVRDDAGENAADFSRGCAGGRISHLLFATHPHSAIRELTLGDTPWLHGLHLGSHPVEQSCDEQRHAARHHQDAKGAGDAVAARNCLFREDDERSSEHPG